MREISKTKNNELFSSVALCTYLYSNQLYEEDEKLTNKSEYSRHSPETSILHRHKKV
jgi:hypothetical protein